MLPEYRSFSEYNTEDEEVLTNILFDEYKEVVSQKQAEFLWWEAYSRSHSWGLEEVYCTFVYMVRIFHKAKSL
jgi:hypothetical protein